MSTTPRYLVLAYYAFVKVDDPHRLVQEHKDFFQGRDVASRIYISEEGINGQMSAVEHDAQAYMDWLRSKTPFKHIYFKVHESSENVFPRKTVKYRQQLVALDEQVDLAQVGTHLSPAEWKQRLDQHPPLLIDVRNAYESEVGYFEGAERPPCDTFREFRAYTEALAKRVDPATPVMMYCTGGIRCEPYSALLKKYGFKEVYQLDGGIINYGLKEGSAHWLGKLFVFDDRLTVPISDEPTCVVGKCASCGGDSESYYNCANMDCNRLFLCCPTCLERLQGCCCEQCQNSERVRPYHHQNPHKPFRKWYHYFPDASTAK